MIRVKICGNRTAGDVALGVAAGADAVGFIVGVRHPTADALSPGDARMLLDHVPAFVTSVLVTHVVDPGAIVRLHEAVPARAIQLHDAITSNDMAVVRNALPRVTLIKAIHVEGTQAIAHAFAYAPLADAILLDSRFGDRIGGTGVTHDWALSRRIVDAVDAPVILAGGLTPDNVAEAIEAARPFAVDVNSGVKGADGRKDAGRVSAFVRRAKAWTSAGPVSTSGGR
jgi:phosphoribosylanthranilate isomerase